MSCCPLRKLALLGCLAVAFSGCYPTKPMYLNDTGDLSYYIDQATQIEYPDVNPAALAEVNQCQPPVTVIDPEFRSFFDLSLEECVGIALQNSKVIRGYGTPSLQGSRVSPGIDNLVNGPAGAGTFYNVAVRETEPGFIGTPGQLSSPGGITTNTGLETNQGVESALAEFDTQLTSRLFWDKSDQPRNVSNTTPIDRTNFQQDTVQFQTEFAKKTASGTQLLARNVNVYTANNIPLASDPIAPGFQVLPSWWRTALEFEVRQPLLRGRGAFINRMPVVISRIGTDQELANLEAQLQNMVTNVEIRYWDLNCAYRNLEAAKAGRNAALETWRIVHDQYNEGADVNIQQVAQASNQYHFFDSQVIESFNNLLTAESSLRFLMGIATTDGQILRPIDEPVLAPVEFEWCAALDEALTYRPELRQERWELKKRELALAYSKNGLLPELNVTGLYRMLGLGQKYATDQDGAPNFPNPGSGAWDGLWEGDFQEAQLGLSYGMPVGFRRELANVRNAQLKLAREHARLEDMELDVTRELSNAFQALDAQRELMKSAFNQWADAEVEWRHFEELRNAGVETLDVALDAQRRRAQAEGSFYNALCEYNKVIALIHRRKGTTLAYNSIDFTEGRWTGKAYLDASENARRRGASRPMNYGWSRPEVISTGPVWPTAGTTGAGAASTMPIPATNNGAIQGEMTPGEVIYPEDTFPALDDSRMYQPGLPPMGTTDSYNIPGPPLGSSTPSNNPVHDPAVIQASYQVQQPAAMRPSPSLDAALERSQPKFDRLTAPVPSSNDAAGNATPSNSHASTENVDWNRFGLANPSENGDGVRASIRMTPSGNQ